MRYKEMHRFKDILERCFREGKNEVHDRFTKPNIGSRNMAETKTKSHKSVNLPQGTISGRPDFRDMPKCQAKAKSTGQRCKNVAVKGKRVCYIHGGKSTGAKTEQGKRRSKYARLRHGDYSAQVKRNRRTLMMLKRIAKWKGLL
jgi:hypothetical protein